MRAESILDLIGDTPHLHLTRLFPGPVDVWMKLERANPAGSIKDRIALSMVEDAEARGLLPPHGTIIEPTSGNTGIGLAMVAAVKGHELVLVMPESMSPERRKLMAAYGAKFHLTPKEGGMKGAIERARELVAEKPGAWMPSQFDNPANARIHRDASAREILSDFPDGVDALVTGVGTGGHITGLGLVLKARFPSIQVIAVEPERSAVLSGGEPRPHRIQGIGAGFVPGVLDQSVLDRVMTVSEVEAFAYMRHAARREGALVGISSGASLAAVARLLPELEPGSTVLTYCYDTGERYLSIEELFE
jgi:cysteine synthase A